MPTSTLSRTARYTVVDPRSDNAMPSNAGAIHELPLPHFQAVALDFSPRRVEARNDRSALVMQWHPHQQRNP